MYKQIKIYFYQQIGGIYLSIVDKFITKFDEYNTNEKIELIKNLLYGRDDKYTEKCIYTNLNYQHRVIIAIWIINNVCIGNNSIFF